MSASLAAAPASPSPSEPAKPAVQGGVGVGLAGELFAVLVGQAGADKPAGAAQAGSASAAGRRAQEKRDGADAAAAASDGKAKADDKHADAGLTDGATAATVPDTTLAAASLLVGAAPTPGAPTAGQPAADSAPSAGATTAPNVLPLDPAGLADAAQTATAAVAAALGDKVPGPAVPAEGRTAALADGNPSPGLEPPLAQVGAPAADFAVADASPPPVAAPSPRLAKPTAPTGPAAPTAPTTPTDPTPQNPALLGAEPVVAAAEGDAPAPAGTQPLLDPSAATPGLSADAGAAAKPASSRAAGAAKPAGPAGAKTASTTPGAESRAAGQAGPEGEGLRQLTIAKTDTAPSDDGQAATAGAAEEDVPSAGSAAEAGPPGGAGSIGTQASAGPNTTGAGAASATVSSGTISSLAAQMLRKLDGKTSRFDVQLDPAGLGGVKVSVQIDARGRLSASMAFDRPESADALRARSDELKSALQRQGFDLADGALSFESGSGGFASEGWAAEDQGAATWRGRAFGLAADAADLVDQTVAAAQRSGALGGLDIRI